MDPDLDGDGHFRASKVPEDHLQQHVDIVARELGFRKPRYDVRYGTQPGDNYSSVLYRVEVSEDGRKLSIMVKGAPQNAALRKSMNSEAAFRNEVGIYKTILPFYEKMMRKHGLLREDECYPNAPRCYKAESEEDGGRESSLVLEDMRPHGFVMADRCIGQDEEHCRVVLRALAHLHAASLAAEHLHPEDFPRLRGSVKELMSDGIAFEQIFNSDRMRSKVLGMIEDRFPKGHNIYEKISRVFSNALEDLLSTCQPCDEGGNVISHGDCWTNNMLFKYSESGKVQTVCLVDFQVSRYASPVLDLSYFLYTCTERSMRRQHLHELLRHYLRELHQRMRVLGVPNPDALFSWSRLQDHLKRCARYGLYLAVVVVPLFVAKQDEVPDVYKVEEGSNLADAFKVTQKDPTEVNNRVSDVVEEMFEAGYL